MAFILVGCCTTAAPSFWRQISVRDVIYWCSGSAYSSFKTLVLFPTMATLPQVNYTTQLSHMSDFNSTAKALANNPSHVPSRHGGREPSESQRANKIQYSEEDEPRAQGQNAFDSERALNDQPTQSGKCRSPFPQSYS